MSSKVNIAVDTMGGENAPEKIIDGIEISLQSNQDKFFFLYGKEDSLEKVIAKKKLIKQYSKIINTKDVISDEESPLNAAKRGKESSMWKAIESQKEKKTDISLSAGNTGALLIKFAVPSAVFKATFPVNPSVIITSTFPSIIWFPST